MSKSKTIKPVVVPVASRVEFEETVDEIARLDVKLQECTATLKAKHQEIDDTFGVQAKVLEEKIALLMDRAEPYFVEHQTELCAKGQKQGETKLATFGIRTGMLKVVKKVKTSFDKLAEEWSVSDKLKAFTRLVPEINKEKIIALWKNDREGFRSTIPSGITVTQDDSFWVEPKADEQVS